MEITTEKLVSAFRSVPESSKRTGVTEDEWREFVRKMRAGEAEIVYFTGKGKKGTEVIERKSVGADREKLTVVTDRPKSRAEMEEFLQVDNVTTFLERYWTMTGKRADGRIAYSALIACKVQNFYTTEELQARLAQLLPKFTPRKLSRPTRTAPTAISALSSDHHAGAVIKDSYYDTRWDKDVLKQHMTVYADRISEYKCEHDEFRIVLAGDQLDGFNQQTTRGGHNLGSLSNKEQFDIYIEVMTDFYTRVLSLGLADRVKIINVDNSNHAGNALSYMANTALKLWLQGTFPEVMVENNTKAIFHDMYGVHAFAYTHGKDEKHMVRPMPFKLDPKTDVTVSEYFRHHRLQDKVCHFIKGDLHQFGEEFGSCFRYLNLPAVVTGSNYSESNYNKSKPGALIEVYHRDSDRVIQDKVWF